MTTVILITIFFLLIRTYLKQSLKIFQSLCSGIATSVGQHRTFFFFASCLGCSQSRPKSWSHLDTWTILVAGEVPARVAAGAAAGTWCQLTTKPV